MVSKVEPATSPSGPFVTEATREPNFSPIRGSWRRQSCNTYLWKVERRNPTHFCGRPVRGQGSIHKVPWILDACFFAGLLNRLVCSTARTMTTHVEFRERPDFLRKPRRGRSATRTA
jgi:hypothetical protein